MKYRIMAGILVLIILGFGFWGMEKKETYTNLAEDESYLQLADACANTEKFARMDADIKKESLSDSPIICRVEVLEEVSFAPYNIGTQRIVVKEVYAGEDIEPGEEYYLCDTWCHIEIRNPKKRILFTGCINLPVVHKEYLVFADRIRKDRKYDVPLLWASRCGYSASIYCCEEIPNQAVMPDGHDGTAVPYALVKDCEFFADTEETLRVMEETKEYFLQKYVYAR